MAFALGKARARGGSAVLPDGPIKPFDFDLKNRLYLFGALGACAYSEAPSQHLGLVFSCPASLYVMLKCAKRVFHRPTSDFNAV